MCHEGASHEGCHEGSGWCKLVNRPIPDSRSLILVADNKIAAMGMEQGELRY